MKKLTIDAWLGAARLGAGYGDCANVLCSECPFNKKGRLGGCVDENEGMMNGISKSRELYKEHIWLKKLDLL
jgi:hypothetical protein